jgi:deoxyribonuclease-4
MVIAGVHVSIAGSLLNVFDRAEERGCNCFQIFTKNPRGWVAKPISENLAEEFSKSAKSSFPGLVFAHISYLPNLAGEKPEIYKRSEEALVTELERCNILSIPYLVTHLGHANDGIEEGKNRVISAVNNALSKNRGDTKLLLENTAGEKNSVGSRLEDIAEVISHISHKSRIGICIDTCHAFAAGYDLRSNDAVTDFVNQVDEIIGLKYLNLIHLNDVKGNLGSGLDRHEHIGLGSIGYLGIRSILHQPSLRNIPCVCETPVDNRRGDVENIKKVRELAQ